MAISTTHYQIIRTLAEQGRLPRGGTLLEIGGGRWLGDMWLGDMDPLAMIDDILRLERDSARRDWLVGELKSAVAKRLPEYYPRLFYELYFAPQAIHSVALEQIDATGSFAIDRQCEVVIDHLAAAQVFNVAGLLQAIHDCTATGGMMIHETPLTGGAQHPYYHMQATLFFDLAAHNEYGVRAMYIEDVAGRTARPVTSRDQLYELADSKQIPKDALLLTVLMKTVERPFEFPIQGYYRKDLSDSGTRLWKTLR